MATCHQNCIRYRVLGVNVNWEQLGAIGELVSGIAVLATLLYLAIQIRQAKNLMLSSAHQNRTDRNIALVHFIAND